MQIATVARLARLMSCRRPKLGHLNGTNNCEKLLKSPHAGLEILDSLTKNGCVQGGKNLRSLAIYFSLCRAHSDSQRCKMLAEKAAEKFAAAQVDVDRLEVLVQSLGVLRRAESLVLALDNCLKIP